MENSILKDNESKTGKQDQLSSSDISSRIKSTNSVDITIYQVLNEHGAQTRTDLIKLTGIARSTLFDSLLRLLFYEKFVMLCACHLHHKSKSPE